MCREVQVIENKKQMSRCIRRQREKKNRDIWWVDGKWQVWGR